MLAPYLSAEAMLVKCSHYNAVPIHANINNEKKTKKKHQKQRQLTICPSVKVFT